MPDVAPDVETVQGWLDRSPFIAFLGVRVEVVDAEAGIVTMTMPARPELERSGGGGGQFHGGQFHGGPIAAFIDIVGDFAVAVKVGGGVPTINLRVDYLRPSTGVRLTGTATARRVGRTVGVVDIDVTDADGRLTAIGRGTYSTAVG
jgi:uncharacterized protein (TIGR00369 family)